MERVEARRQAPALSWPPGTRGCRGRRGEGAGVQGAGLQGEGEGVASLLFTFSLF